MSKKIKLNRKSERIVVGLSGGVDSSVALLLLKEQGWDPIGVSLKLPVWKNTKNCLKENVCCTKEAFETARAICKKAGVKYHIIDARRDFQKKVMDYFVKEYKNNRTPNPCVVCNRELKFKKLLEFANKRGIKYVATGHYAKTIFDKKQGTWHLATAKDKNKDQTYSLSCLPQKWLGRIIFPLGNYLKDEVYEMAKKRGLGFFLKKKQSQDFCFVSGKSLREFLREKIKPAKGDIIDEKGNKIGTHEGLCFYTLGQRKGINAQNGPYYVIGFNVAENRLIASKDARKALRQSARLFPCHISESGNFLSKTRAQQELTQTNFVKDKKGAMFVKFGKNGKLLTPGQFCAAYKNNICLGGGRILL